MPRHCRVVHAAPQRNGVASSSQVPYECHGIAVWFMRLRKEVVLLHRCSHLGMPRHCRVVHAAPQRNGVAQSSQSLRNASALPCGPCGSAKKWCCSIVAGHRGMPRHCLVVHAAPQRNGVASSSQVIEECLGIALWSMRLRKEMVLLHRRRSY
ncbi:hypothetical protein Aduo_014737 [Ancylostoma duodenale]